MLNSSQNDASGVEHLPSGIYRHYKGGSYQVMGTVRHSETEEVLVLYRPLYGAGELWVRPLGMFRESVTVNGERLKRFELVKRQHYEFPSE